MSRDKATSKYGPDVGERNRKRVYDYFRKNICAKQSDCAKALGISAVAVNRHVRSIRNGWTPDEGV